MSLATIARAICLSLILAFHGVRALEAQVPADLAPSEQVWQVQLADGSTLFGRVVEVGPDQITVVSEGGVRVELNRAQIRSIAPVRGVIRDGELWPEDANTTRLFFGPTGRMMRQGEGYVAAFELLLPFVSYSVTDWLTLAGGTPLVPDGIGELFYLAPKVGLVQRPDLGVSAGVLAFFSTYDDFDSAGIVYAVGTRGSSDRSVTVGAGWPFASGDLENFPVFMAGGESRVSRRLKLVSENYLVSLENGSSSDQLGMVSGGVRFIGDRLSADLGVGLGFDDTDLVCCIPLVNFVYHFGEGGQ